MKEYIDRPQAQRNRIIAIINEVLFALFVFFFYIIFQRDLIALMQETWSHGQTSNNPVVTALVVLVVLLLVQRAVRAITRLHGRWDAFTWVPSFMLLSLSTSVQLPSLSFRLRSWTIVGAVVIAVLYAVVFISHAFHSDKKTPLANLLCPNLVVIVLSALVCMEMTNHDAALHQELAAFRHADRGETERVADVGRRSLETTPMLTALRNVALVQTDRAGDELFRYPQPLRSDGLGVEHFLRQDTRFGSDAFYSFLGEEPYGGESAAVFCERIYRQDDTPFHRNLYIASLLLDCRLSDFASEFPPSQMLAESVHVDSLPRHYREAWVLASYLYRDKDMLVDYDDPEMQSLFNEFRSSLNSSHRTVHETLNELFLTYGKTYWYYYYRETTSLTDDSHTNVPKK